MTDAERKALKLALLQFKRFWMAPVGPHTELQADRLIDVISELVKTMEETR